jgi:hypothetical protein
MELIGLVHREQWGARQPRNVTPLEDKDLRGIAVHYSAMAAVEDHAGCDDRVRQIQNGHMDGNGWADIAYSWLTCQHGYAFQGRGWGVRTAANGTNAANDRYHAVCFLGADREGRDDVTPTGRKVIASVIAQGRDLYPKAWEVRLHKDFRATACPGLELSSWVRADMPVDWDTGERPADMPVGEAVPIIVRSKPVAVHGCATGGYWIATEDGGVFSFGGAPFHGSLGGIALNAPVVDLVGTKTGQGYWLVAADGGMFPFGDADFHGSLAGMALNAPVIDMAVSADDDGAWLLGGDGGLFGLGDAPFGGNIVYRP